MEKEMLYRLLGIFIVFNLFGIILLVGSDGNTTTSNVIQEERVFEESVIEEETVNDILSESSLEKEIVFVPEENIPEDFVAQEETDLDENVEFVSPEPFPEDEVIVQEENDSSSSSSGVSCGNDDYNCGDFSSCSEVMDVFNSCSYDVNRLDGDNDGIPCESLCG